MDAGFDWVVHQAEEGEGEGVIGSLGWRNTTTGSGGHIVYDWSVDSQKEDGWTDEQCEEVVRGVFQDVLNKASRSDMKNWKTIPYGLWEGSHQGRKYELADTELHLYIYGKDEDKWERISVHFDFNDGEKEREEISYTNNNQTIYREGWNTADGYNAEARPINEDEDLLAVYDDGGEHKGFIEMEDDEEEEAVEIDISDEEMNEIAEIKLGAETESFEGVKKGRFGKMKYSFGIESSTELTDSEESQCRWLVEGLAVSLMTQSTSYELCEICEEGEQEWACPNCGNKTVDDENDGCSECGTFSEYFEPSNCPHQEEASEGIPEWLFDGRPRVHNGREYRFYMNDVANQNRNLKLSGPTQGIDVIIYGNPKQQDRWNAIYIRYFYEPDIKLGAESKSMFGKDKNGKMYARKRNGEIITHNADFVKPSRDWLSLALGTAAVVIGGSLFLQNRGVFKADGDEMAPVGTGEPSLVAHPTTGDLLPADYEEMIVESTGYAVPVIPVSLDPSFMGSRFHALPTDRVVESNEPGIGAHTDVAINRDTNYREPEQSLITEPPFAYRFNAEAACECSIFDKIKSFFTGKPCCVEEKEANSVTGQTPYFGVGFDGRNTQERVIKETNPVSLDPSVSPFLPLNLSGYTGQAYAPPTVYSSMMAVGQAGQNPAFTSTSSSVGANRAGSRSVDSSSLQSVHGTLSAGMNQSYTDGSRTMSLSQWSIEYDVSQISDTEAFAVSRASGERSMIRRV